MSVQRPQEPPIWGVMKKKTLFSANQLTVRQQGCQAAIGPGSPQARQLCSAPWSALLCPWLVCLVLGWAVSHAEPQKGSLQDLGKGKVLSPSKRGAGLHGQKSLPLVGLLHKGGLRWQEQCRQEVQYRGRQLSTGFSAVCRRGPCAEMAAKLCFQKKMESS